jgi:hypothetical protein
MAFPWFNEWFKQWFTMVYHMAVCQNLVPLVNIKIAGKWMFIPLKMVLIGIDPYPFLSCHIHTDMTHGTWNSPVS